MSFATSYFARYKSLPPFFTAQPDKDLIIVVMIPCYDDISIFETLRSLEDAIPVRSGIEVIVVVNSGETTPAATVERNRTIYTRLQQQANESYYSHFQVLPILIEGTEKKKAGVGFARKAGMDEAVRRFAAIDCPSGLIVSLDADTLVAPNYLQVAEKAYHNASANCFTFQFQHLYDPERYTEAEIHACQLYELYLRYFHSALKMLNVPYAIHSIGSCFAVRAEAYTKLGGMSMRQAGEDFYFLQKAVKMQPVCEMDELIVFPAPRISDRVPFGTGASVKHIMAEGSYRVYNFELFRLLKTFYDLFPAFEREDVQAYIPPEIMNFIGLNPFNHSLVECRKYSSSPNTFLKRMYDRFDAFFIVKFLNTFDKNSAVPPINVLEAARILNKETATAN
ncbi:MAG: hypothetical protein LBE79_01300 [Tannerella sp.]|jgi:glycosyltransferase involved in cell wall biosynthesis|nr:hypothetical protein [Tannerella sp.]